MNNKIFAGIGSRETPFDIQLLMHDIGAYLGERGYTLRSGHCEGADLAFEKGVDSVKGKKEIFLQSDCTKEALELGLKFHPNPKALKTKFTRQLIGRNGMIILGQNLDVPCGHVIYYAKEDQLTREVSGGTAQGIRIARYHGIKCFNLYFEDVKKKFMDKIYFGGGKK